MRKINFYWPVWSDHVQTCEQNMLLVYLRLRLKLLLPSTSQRDYTILLYEHKLYI